MIDTPPTPPPRSLYTLPKYHFPPYEGRPGLAYVVASAPRCGSNLLCTSLWRTGAMGAPMEYFNPWSIFVEMSTRLGARTFREYMTQLLRHRVSPNGVFAAKVHWEHLPFATLAKIWAWLPDAHFIHITRRDRLAQAVSWELAAQTEAWDSNIDGTDASTAAYSSARIQRRIQMIEAAERGWRGSFERSNVKPIEVCYEDLVADTEGTVAAIVEALGVSTGGAAVIDLPAIERQFSDVNADWIQRFKDERARPAAAPPGDRAANLGPTG